MGQIGARARWPALASVAIVIGSAAVALVFLTTAGPQTVARTDMALVGDAVDAVNITVRCGPVGAGGQGEWGAAAEIACARPALRRLAAAGAVVTLGGIVGIALASDRWVRRSGDPRTGPGGTLRRVARLTSSLLLAAGLSAVGVGLGLLVLADEATRLRADETALLDAVASGGEVLASFEVVDLSSTGGGRYEEEFWVVLATASAGGEALDAVGRMLTEAGWQAREVGASFDDGWVALRGLAGATPDLVEVGLARAALGEDADVTANARRLLAAELPADVRAVAVRLAPSRLAG